MSSLSDPRNLATAALYLALLWLGLAARPWEVPLEWAGRRPSVRCGCSPERRLRYPTTDLCSALRRCARAAGAQPTTALQQTSSACPLPVAQAAPSRVLQERRWRLAVTAGLLVGPFFPASNVLFYVGTFIGERLLYFPSGMG